MEQRVLLTATPYPTHNATVGLNLDGFADDSTIGAFNDLATLFRPWGTLVTPYQPDASIPVTNPSDPWPDNYPLADAAAITYATTYPNGDYAVSYDGSGTVNFTGLGPGTGYTVTSHVGNHWTGVLHLQKDANDGGILEIRLTGIDTSNPIRNIHIISPDADFARSPTFRPVFLDKLPLWNGTLRFMDWLQTNENSLVHWSDRTQVNRFSYVTAGGVPIEHIIELANLVHKDVWINTLLHADDDYVRHVAQMFATGLNPSLKVFVENSNELWNNQFQQSRDLLFESRDDPDPYIVGGDDFGRMAQLAGKKMLHVSNLFKEEFGAARFASQVRPIFGCHIALKYWAVNAMEYIQRATQRPANEAIYGLAIAPYVGAQGDMNHIDNASLTPEILFAWMHSFIDGNLRFWTHEHKQIADYYGLHLESYEAGQSLQAQNLKNEELKVAAQDMPGMADVYKHLINMWVEEGGDVFNNFSLANHYSVNGYWGVLDRIDRPTSTKFQAVTSMISGIAPSPTAAVSVSGNLAGNRGDTVHAFVDIDNATGLTAVDFKLTYDAARLSITAADVLRAGVLAGWPPLTVNANTPGVLIIEGFSGTVAASGAGHLFDLAFHVKADAPAGTSALHVDASVTKLNEGQIVATFTDGAIAVPVGTTITGAALGGSPEGTPITLAADLIGAATGNVGYFWHVLAANGQVIADSTNPQFTFTPNDNGSYTVTLIVTDSGNHTGTDTRVVTVGNVAPAVTITGGPPGPTPEGTAVTLGAGVVEPGSADVLTYAWTVTKGGQAVTTGSGSAFAFTPADNGDYVVTLTVSDDDGGVSNTASRTIAVTNVAPTVVINGVPASPVEGTAIHLTKVVSDPGSADTFTYLWTVLKDGVSYLTGTGETFDFTPDDQGTYTVTLVVTDDDQGVGSATKVIGVGNVAPSVVVNGAPGSAGEGTLIQLTAAASDAGSHDVLTYAWSVTKNGSPYAAGATDSFAFRPDDDGSYVVTLVVSDADGGSTTVVKTIGVTNVAPVATIGGGAGTRLEGGLIHLTSGVTDAGSADTFGYAWSVTKNNAAYGGGGSAATYDFTPDDEGTYVVTLTVTDDNGGAHTVTKTIVVDNVPPTVVIVGAPAGTADEGTLIHLTSTVTDPGLADAKVYAWSVTKNGTLFKSGSAAAFDFTPDDNGQYVVTLTVTDGDGGVGTDAKTIVVGNVAPTAAITGAPGPSPEGTTITLGSTAGDVASADTLSYLWTVKRNGAAYAVTGNTSGTFAFTPGDDGEYVVTLKVSDDDGGFATDAVTIQVTNVAPAAAIGGGGGTRLEGAAIALTGTFTDPGSADTQTFAWKVTKNGADYLAATTQNFTFTPDDDGDYVVTFKVTDNNGGTTTATKAITVANAAPTAVINGAPAGATVEGTAVNLTAGVTDAGVTDAGVNDTHTYAWTVTRGGVQYLTGTAAAFTFTPDDNGDYLVTLTVTDNKGATASDSRTVTVGNANPVASIGGAPASAVGEGTPIHLVGSFTDAGQADGHTYLWTVKKNGQNFAGGTGTTIDFTPDDDGTYAVTFKVTDDDGGVGTATATIEAENVRPVVAIVGAPASAVEGTKIDLTAGVTDAGTADTHDYQWSVTKNGAAYKSATTPAFSFTPNDNGTYVVTLTVTDDDGGARKVTAEIGVTNAAPTAAIIGAPATSPEGTAVALTGAYGDAGAADVLTFDWAVTKDGSAYASGAGADFTFTPTDEGEYVVTFTVSDDDGGTKSDSKTIVVENVAPTAAIDNAPATSAEGALIQLTGSASDPGADTLTKTWKVMLGSDVYAQGTGAAFAFTPADDGTYVVTFKVVDGDGGVTSDTKTIVVANVKPVVTIHDAPTDAVEGQPIALTGTFVDPGTLDPHTLAWSVKKNNAFYAAGAGAAFTFTPTDEGVYVVTLTVTDDDASGVATATINVGNVAPVAALSATPTTSAEGTTITASGSASDAGEADVLAYHWAVTKGGVAFASGDTAAVSFKPDDNGAYVLTFTVSDGDGGSDTITRNIGVTNVAPTVAITGASATAPEGTAISLGRTIVDPGSADTFTYLWTVTKDGQAFASGTAAAFTFTPDAPGVYAVDLTVKDDDQGAGHDATSITATHVSFRITSLTATDYGFDVAFNRPANFAGLNLYHNDGSPTGAVDLTLTGVAQGRVRGSLVYDAARGVYSFVATGGPLTSDAYTVWLGSAAGAADGWVDVRGEPLDGNADGTAGDAAVRTFTVARNPADRIVTLGDFARGPGQAVNLPATGAGIPIRVNDAIGLTGVTLTVNFDAALLDVTGVSGPAGWSTALAHDAAGRVTITASGPALGEGAGELFRLTAAVPAGAAVGAMELIRISGLSLNGGQVAGYADAAVHAVAYFGDTSGKGGYGGTDAMLIARVAAGLDEGFDAFPRLDPLVVGDVTGNGSLSGLDAHFVARMSVGLEQAQIPAMPAGAAAPLPSAAPGAAQVTLSLPSNVLARPGATIHVPVNVSAFGDVRALDLTITYDTGLLDLTDAGVTLGASAAGWTLVQNVNDAAGSLRLTLYRTDGAAGVAGTMLDLAFHVPDAAPSGAAPISLNGAADEGAVALPSAAGGLVIDATPPAVLSARFDPNGGKHRLTVRFGEDVGPSLSIDDVTLFDSVTQTTVDRSRMTLAYDPATLTATITFTGFAGGVLADGDYTLTIAGATVTDAAGNGLDGAGGGVGSGGSDFAFGFRQMLGDVNLDGAVDQADAQIVRGALGGTVINAENGDADGDHRVDFNDLIPLAQHYNQAGVGAGEGDFTGDGMVDFNDLVVLAQNYNRDGRGDLNGDGVIDQADLDLIDGIVSPPVAAAPAPAVAMGVEPEVAGVVAAGSVADPVVDVPAAVAMTVGVVPAPVVAAAAVEAVAVAAVPHSAPATVVTRAVVTTPRAAAKAEPVRQAVRAPLGAATKPAKVAKPAVAAVAAVPPKRAASKAAASAAGTAPKPFNSTRRIKREWIFG